MSTKSTKHEAIYIFSILLRIVIASSIQLLSADSLLPTLYTTILLTMMLRLTSFAKVVGVAKMLVSYEVIIIKLKNLVHASLSLAGTEAAPDVKTRCVRTCMRNC